MSQSAQKAAPADLKVAAPRWLYFAIFAISGFSGLIYESIWSHYLKLFLGHAAYAQSLVLIIFMGGMAAGSWIASRFSRRSKIPILGYAIVEAIVGVIALLFHDVFTGIVDSFYTSILPSVGSPALGATLKWLAASLLIMPQSILLGMTFPLMSAGIIRRFPDTPGGSIAMLYFTNSIGASIGVLASGFLFIGMFGLPGTILTAGLLNIALALIVWILVRLDPKPETEPLPQTEATGSRDSLRTLFLVAAFITGAASFIYEIAWIRMLSLVLGASTHSFELMLSAFIAGLAFGGLWIKRRIDKIKDPVRFSGWVQLIMGVFALLTIPVYVSSYEWMSWLLGTLAKTEGGFAGYSLASHVISLLVMLPTTFMAGMTLPLFTYVLLDRGEGESSIGRIYAANTVGAIVGVLFAVHIGLSVLGLKNLILFGAALDIVLAVVLLRRSKPAEKRNTPMAVGGLIGAAAIVMTIGLANMDPRLLMSGVYRFGVADATMNDEVLFYKDGKTSSVSLRRANDDIVVLATNGKPDASIQMNRDKPASADEITMTLAGTLPFAYMPDATRIANIGMGSGQTTHVLLGNERVEIVDTVEIEREMVRASRGFGEHVERAYEDPRSRIFIEDAKTYFSLHNSVYDVIIAEPSNPWVSGVSSLFSTEFYTTIQNYLEDDGLFIQWIQLYEFNDHLLESILKALEANFGDFEIYSTDFIDILIIARKEGDLGAPNYAPLFEGELGRSLERVLVTSPSDLQVRKLTSSDVLRPYLQLTATPVNSDYFPYVDLNAGEARFIFGRAEIFGSWAHAPLPVIEMLNKDSIEFRQVTLSAQLMRGESIAAARWLSDKVGNSSLVDPATSENLSSNQIGYIADWLLMAGADCAVDVNPQRWRETVFYVATTALPYLEAEDGLALIDSAHPPDCAVNSEGKAPDWAELFRSVASRDGDGMSTSSRAILNGDVEELDVARQGYVVAAAMLGDISSGRPADAHELWVSHGEELLGGGPLPPHMRLLLSIAAEGVDQAALAAER